MRREMDKKRVTWLLIFVGVIVALVSGLIGWAYIQRAISDVNANNRVELERVAQKIAHHLNTHVIQLESQLEVLSRTAGINDGAISIEAKKEALSAFAEDKNLVRVGVVDRNGSMFTTDNTVFDARDRTWYKEALKGNATASSSLTDRAGNGESIIVVARPVKVNDKVVSVIFATQYTADYLDSAASSINTRIYHTHVIDGDGTIIMGDSKDAHDRALTNIRQELVPQASSSLLREMATNKKGTFETSINGATGMISFAEIPEHTGWDVVVSTSRDKTPAYSSNVVQRLCIAVLIGIFATTITAVLLAFLFLAFRHERAYLNNALEERLYRNNKTNLYYRRGLFKRLEKIYQTMTFSELSLVAVFEITSLPHYREELGRAFSEVVFDDIITRCHDIEQNNRNAVFGYCDYTTLAVAAWGFSSRKECRDFVRFVYQTLNEPFHTKGITVSPRIKAGARLFFKNEENASDAETLYDQAIEALDITIDSPTETISFFDNALEAQKFHRQALLNALPEAIRSGEFMLVYQPVYRFSSQEIVGLEALLRWNSAAFGITLPSEFLPLVLELGYLPELGRWVIDKMFADAAGTNCPNIVWTFNAAPIELFSPDYADYVIERFNHYGLRRGQVAIELDSRKLLQFGTRLSETFARIHEHGIRLNIDNFGDEQFALAALAVLPVDSIKLAGRYSDNLELDKKNQMTVTCVREFAEHLGFEIAAQGIENQLQEQLLTAYGFDIGQGRYLSRPLPLSMLTAQLKIQIGDIEEGDDAQTAD